MKSTWKKHQNNAMMSSTESTSSLPLASILVARFLRSNNYSETLDTFIREAGLPADVGRIVTKPKIIASTTSPDYSEGSSTAASEHDSWTLEGVIQEKKRFDQSWRFERYGDDDEASKRDRWSVPAPSKPNLVETPGSSNILSVSVKPWQRGVLGDDCASPSPSTSPPSYIVATGADKRLNLFCISPSNEIAASLSGLSDSPILSHASIRNGRYQLTTSMSGQLSLIKNDDLLDQRRDHSKYAVQVVAYEEGEDQVWVVTAGWDAKVLIYKMIISSSSCTIGEPVSTIKLTSNPISILIVSNPETKDLILLVSRRDSTYLYYYALKSLNRSGEGILLGKQNLAPNSNAWIAFSPLCLALSPHDPSLLAVALSTLPHMKVMIVRLLFPFSEDVGDTTTAATAATVVEIAPETHLSQAMAALALQNREDAAIIIQANTFAPQTAYSTPQVVWRPDGSGLWVTGDDGVIRGIETKTGKVITMLKDGHEIGSKVRSIWAGLVRVNFTEKDDKEEVEEWVVSGGFDKRLIVWKI